MDSCPTTLPLGSSQSKRQSNVRIIEPVEHDILVRTKRSIASEIFGERSSIEAWLFDFGVRNTKSTGTLWIMWAIGVCAGLLTLFEGVPSGFVWLSALMLPLPTVTFLLFSKDLVLELLSDWDFYIIQVLQLAMAVFAVQEIHGQSRAFWAFCLPTLLVAPLTDAYPAKYRALFVRLYFIGLSIIFVMWNLMLVFVLHKFHSVTVHLADSATLTLFYVRPIWVSIQHPDRFVLLRSEMRTSSTEICAAEKSVDGQVTYGTPNHRHHVHLPLFSSPRLEKTLTESVSPGEAHDTLEGV